MQYINHRINTRAQLAHVPKGNGVEIDIRYHNDTLILHHDPFAHHTNNPETLRKFLEGWQHAGPLILNVKSEGIEQSCIALMKEFNLTNWFFLDISMPYFAIYSEHAKNNTFQGFCVENLAVRFSEREPIDYALAFSGAARWVWVDCFTKFPLGAEEVSKLREAGYKLCLVSPELQGHSLDRIQEFRQKSIDFDIDAVCTKRPDLWGQPTSPELVTYLETQYPFQK